MEAAEEIARQLRLRDLGGLIAIDFIDMMDQKHNAEVEKAFKKALTMDRARIQLAHISKFGILELSRQKKQSTIQEISYTACPYCHGRGVRPSLEYIALNAYRKVETQAVKGLAAELKVTVPYEIADYLQNQKRAEISRLETDYDMDINIYGNHESAWEDCRIETVKRELPVGLDASQLRKTDSGHNEQKEDDLLDTEPTENEEFEVSEKIDSVEKPQDNLPSAGGNIETGEPVPPAKPPLPAEVKKKTHRRPRRRRKTPAEGGTASSATTAGALPAEEKPAEIKSQPPAVEHPAAKNRPAGVRAAKTPPPPKNRPSEKKGKVLPDDPLNKLRKIFEEFDDNY
jgi:ribonuclease E